MNMQTKRNKIKSFVEQTNGKMFQVTFIKKTTGEVRKMTCKSGVFKHSKGGVSGSEHCEDILGTYDMQKATELPEDQRNKAYRNIWLDSVISIKCGDRELLY